MLPATTGFVRLPGEENQPTPAADERVYFLDHMNRGLSFPVHPCLRGFLCVYGAQLHDLPPNAVLHISCFIILCECFLGIAPHWGLFRLCFNVKGQGSGSGPGGLGIQAKPKSGYFKIPMSESVQNWREHWFYVKDKIDEKRSTGLSPFIGDTELQKKRSWSHSLTVSEEQESRALLKKVIELQTTEGKVVTGAHLVTAFLRRRIQPLQDRAHPMYEYTGADDCTRVSTEDFSSNELTQVVKTLTGLKARIGELTSPVACYDAQHPLPEGHAQPISEPTILPNEVPEMLVRDPPSDPSVGTAHSEGDATEKTAGRKRTRSPAESSGDSQDRMKRAATGAVQEDVDLSAATLSASEVLEAVPLSFIPPPAKGAQVPDALLPWEACTTSEEDDDESEPRTTTLSTPEQTSTLKEIEEKIGEDNSPDKAKSPPLAIQETAVPIPTPAASTPAAEHPFVRRLLDVGDEYLQLESKNRKLMDQLQESKDALDKVIHERDNARCLAKDLKEELARVQKELPDQLEAARAEAAHKVEERLAAERTEKDSALATRLLNLGNALTSALGLSAEQYAPPKEMTLDAAVGSAETFASRMAGVLAASSAALGALNRLVLPLQEIPKDLETLAETFQPEGDSFPKFLREQTVRGSATTFKILLAHGVDVDLNAIASAWQENLT